MENTTSASVHVMSRPRLQHSASRTYHQCECHDHPSPHSSPRSAALPSPPDSPSLDPYADIDLDSISSFPSGSSSVFFSSSAGSPHSQQRHPEHEHDAGLIIPSLTLPSALQRPTPYGQTLGDLSLLLVGPSGAGKTALAEFLADGDDVVDTAEWEDIEGGRIFRASTDWIEEHDPHGLERFEGSANVSFTELDGFDSAEKSERVVERILKNILDTFRDVRSQIDSSPSSPLLHSLIASSHSPLYTALIYITATPLTEQDHEIISALSSSIPIIPYCTTSLSSPLTSFSHHAGPPPKLASFQPHSQLALRTGLFRTPQTVSALRAEAADRFMRWREVERAVEDVAPPLQTYENHNFPVTAGRRRCTVTQYSGDKSRMERWSKAAWEAMLSEDVARRLRQTRALGKSQANPTSTSLANSVLFTGAPCFAPSLDPLRFRSLVLLSMSLLAPRSSLGCRSFRRASRGESVDRTRSTLRPSRSSSRLGRDKDNADVGGDKWRIWRWGLALFCTGVGIGCVLSALA